MGWPNFSFIVKEALKILTNPQGNKTGLSLFRDCCRWLCCLINAWLENVVYIDRVPYFLLVTKNIF